MKIHITYRQKFNLRLLKQTCSKHRSITKKGKAKQKRTNLSIFRSLLFDICVTTMHNFFSTSFLSLKTFLSLGTVLKFPFPSSSLNSSDTSKWNVIPASPDWLISDWLLGDFGTLRNAVAKLYSILPTYNGIIFILISTSNVAV